jgi:hypothetical protein
MRVLWESSTGVRHGVTHAGSGAGAHTTRGSDSLRRISPTPGDVSQPSVPEGNGG